MGHEPRMAEAVTQVLEVVCPHRHYHHGNGDDSDAWVINPCHTKSLPDNDLLQLFLIKFDAQPRPFRHYRHPGSKFKWLLKQHIAT